MYVSRCTTDTLAYDCLELSLTRTSQRLFSHVSKPPDVLNRETLTPERKTPLRPATIRTVLSLPELELEKEEPSIVFRQCKLVATLGLAATMPPRYALPAPTETETTAGSEITSTELSKPGDEKSTYSIPEDGTPVTIRTRGHRANKSQTSLLIEYFEGGKGDGKDGAGSSRKPSVRVRLTPSKKGRGDHIQLTETKGTRKASVTRRIPLDEAIAAREIELGEGEELSSLGSYASATEESNVSRNPVEVEIDRPRRRRRPASPLIPGDQPYMPGNPSEISAIPTDSFLDGTAGTDLRRGASDFASATLAGVAATTAMDEITNLKTRSAGKEKGKTVDRSDRKRRPKSRATSLSDQAVDDGRSPRRKSGGRGHPDSLVSGADSSVLSSQLTGSHRSYDTHSSRSAVSKSSINNPKLLETVEDAIRRLILPELSALKREQSKRESRRESMTSTNTGTTVSREDLGAGRRRSSGRGEHSQESLKYKERRNREARHEYDDDSLRTPSYDSLDAEYRHDDDGRRGGSSLLKTAAAGAAGAALAKGLTSSMDDNSQTEDRRHRERRRRRAEHSRSHSLGREKYAEEYDDEPAPAPPMPLMSDINPSELTRTSILSADSERPISATEEHLAGQAAARDLRSTSSTPTPESELLGMKHANISHGDLTDLPRGKKEYIEELEDDEGKVPMPRFDEYEDEEPREYSDPGDYPEEEGYDNSYFSTQDVPPPLKYVPYQAGARGLSPIPSVSGYTEGDMDPRNSRNLHSPSLELRHNRSTHSMDSIPSNMRSREFEHMSSEALAAAGDPKKVSSESVDRLPTGQAVRGIGANPDFVHQSSGVESAVASLIDGSMIDQSVLTSGEGYDHGAQRDSYVSYDDQSRGHSSRGYSPDKMSVGSAQHYDKELRDTPGGMSQDQSQDFSEYELDEYGRKVKVTQPRQRNSPTASEAIITAGAVGAAAIALKAAQERKQAAAEGDWHPAGVNRNRSFKERTMEGRGPRDTPTHSIDRFEYDDDEPKLGASGLPDLNDPMPEYGYMDVDQQTNPSVVNERLDGEDEYASGRATPTQKDIKGKQVMYSGHATPTDERGLGLTEAAAVGALGAAAGMAAAHSREQSQDLDEWQRTSAEKKRDTWITNPYEDASPITNPVLDDKILSARVLGVGDGRPLYTGSPGLGAKYDEGYISNGGLASPDVQPREKALGLATGGVAEDPFYVSQNTPTRQLSGMSQGIGSPMFDAATGGGIDRIENKDIVALMQHLMVRDAQRSARDTEIVALLMNAALEMRNSFQEMKDLIQDTGDDVIFANVENTEKLQKAINGPRPFPNAGARSIQSSSLAAGTVDESGQKKKNLWKRALQGLSAKGTTDLTRIEDMLMQLLGEVDVLKTQTAPGSTSAQGRSSENLQGYMQDTQGEKEVGFDREDNSTGSYPSQSGQFAPQSARQSVSRRVSDNRVSTVEEQDEEYEYDHPTPSNERSNPNLLTPGHLDHAVRGSSVPLDTPPQHSSQQPLSAENTPRTEKGKKHKSSSSSGWLPKVSRWSETTASSFGKAFKSKKDSKYNDGQQPSRSGSSLGSYEADYQHDSYDDKLHTGFSHPDLEDSKKRDTLESDATATVAAAVSPEDPKYHVHRNSINLQHPQPRPGQTERFRTALEYSAQEYYDPVTPRSADFGGSQTSLGNIPHPKYASGMHEDGYCSSPNQGGPPRPPKEPLDEYGSQSQTPPKSSRISNLAKSSPQGGQSYDSTYGTLSAGHNSRYTGSPKLENKNLSGAYGAPARRPSGPRAMTPKSPQGDAVRDERRRKRGM